MKQDSYSKRGRGQGRNTAIKPVSGQCDERSGWPGMSDQEKREDMHMKNEILRPEYHSHSTHILGFLRQDGKKIN